MGVGKILTKVEMGSLLRKEEGPIGRKMKTSARGSIMSSGIRGLERETVLAFNSAKRKLERRVKDLPQEMKKNSGTNRESKKKQWVNLRELTTA